MASFHTVSQLIQGMSRAERKHFAQASGYPAETTVYYELFLLILDHPDGQDRVIQKFRIREPKASCSSAMHHLYQKLLDFLSFFNRYESRDSRIKYGLINAQTLYERSLYDACFSMLDSLRELCQQHEMHDWLLMVNRRELEYRNRLGYGEWSESSLMQAHNAINQDLRYLQTQSAHQLQFDLLNTRSKHPNISSSPDAIPFLDDLAIQELQIFSNPRYKSFEADKLHLLFQSEYFMAKGDHKTSLRIFSELNKLFLSNEHLWQDPPVYYLTHLSGILRNLLYLRAWDEMPVYFKVLEAIGKSHPKAQQMVSYIGLHYDLLLKLNGPSSRVDLARLVQQATGLLDLPGGRSPVEVERLLELSVALGLMQLGDYKRCLHQVNPLLIARNSPAQPFEYALRMLLILVHFELGNQDLVEKETRSFSRNLALYQIPDAGEKAFFKCLTRYSPYDPDRFKMDAAKCLEAPLPDHAFHPQLQAGIYLNWRTWLVNRSGCLTLQASKSMSTNK